MKDHLSILIRCDGSARVGFGHLLRCRTLAQELRDLGCQVVFAVREGEAAIDRLRKEEYPVVAANSAHPFDYQDWLTQAVETIQADALIFDARDCPPAQALRHIKDGGTLVAAIDHPDPSKLLADITFHPPVPQLTKPKNKAFEGQAYVGWDWVILGGNFEMPRPCPRQGPLRVLVTMGGSDDAGLTLRAIRALEQLNHEFTATVVLGLGFSRLGELNSLLAKARRTYELLHDIDNMVVVMAGTDLAVASFGVTAYELAAMGVPAIHMCLSPDHEQSASAFVAAGMAGCVGHHGQVSETELAIAIGALLEDEKTRHRMSNESLRRLDGKGAHRIAKHLVERIGNDHSPPAPRSPLASAAGRSRIQTDPHSDQPPGHGAGSSSASRTSYGRRFTLCSDPRI